MQQGCRQWVDGGVRVRRIGWGEALPVVSHITPGFSPPLSSGSSLPLLANREVLDAGRLVVGGRLAIWMLGRHKTRLREAVASKTPLHPEHLLFEAAGGARDICEHEDGGADGNDADSDEMPAVETVEDQQREQHERRGTFSSTKHE